MAFETLSAAKGLSLVNGEHLLLGGTPPGWPGAAVSPSPFSKRRYTWDGDIVVGCTIGCSFCYYRWLNNTAHTIGHGRQGLVRACTPEEMARWLDLSRLFKPGRDILMLCSRSDGSIQQEELTQFLRVFRHDSLVFILHRAPFTQREAQAWGGDHRAVFCTTLTPLSDRFGACPVDTRKQLAGLRLLIRGGVPASRISVMVGPVNRNNIEAAAELVRELAGIGIEFLTYRGCSIGEFGVEPDREELRRLGFLDGAQDETARPPLHEYYKMKNWLDGEVEERLLEASRACGIRAHRNTATLYRNEFGVPVAYNRNNRWRRELGRWKKADPGRLDGFLRSLGYHPASIRECEEGYMVELPDGEVATEDVAMTVGAEFETSVVFSRYRLAPSLQDLKFYARNSLFGPFPAGWEEAVEFAQAWRAISHSAMAGSANVPGGTP